jgi:hypothetical protein
MSEESANEQKTPVDVVIAKFGSATAVSDVLGIQRSNVTHWQNNGGEVPFKHHSKLLKAAKDKGIELTREQLEPDCLA